MIREDLARLIDEYVSRSIVGERLLIEVRQPPELRVTSDKLAIEPWLQAVSTAYRQVA